MESYDTLSCAYVSIAAGSYLEVGMTEEQQSLALVFRTVRSRRRQFVVIARVRMVPTPFNLDINLYRLSGLIRYRMWDEPFYDNESASHALRQAAV